MRAQVRHKRAPCHASSTTRPSSKESKMKSTKMFAVLVAGLLLVVAKAGAEEKANAEETMALTPVRVTVVFTEYVGEKKISSLPYVLSLNSSPEGHPSATSLRMGLRVPFLTKGSVGGQQEVQYQRSEERRVGKECRSR